MGNKFKSSEVSFKRNAITVMKNPLKGRVNKIKINIFTIDNTEKLIQVKTQPVREVLVTYRIF